MARAHSKRKYMATLTLSGMLRKLACVRIIYTVI